MAASIAVHDPEGVWSSTALELTIEETRPEGPARTTEVGIDIAGERFSWSTTRDGHRLAGGLDGKSCELLLDGRTNITDGERDEHRLTCERLRWIRNYYTYLWGLPMKLRDAGTHLAEEVVATEFQGLDVLSLKVTYDEAVGGDTWYFYFDPVTSALVGYRFFHDESKNDGEHITLQDIAAVGVLRLPKRRAWYYNQGGGYLGTDTLVSLERGRDDSGREP
ncbi:MAG: hypothetical protein GY769_13870 [bacterium]|nr:hypothetical protein [bacterium]